MGWQISEEVTWETSVRRGRQAEMLGAEHSGRSSGARSEAGVTGVPQEHRGTEGKGGGGGKAGSGQISGQGGALERVPELGVS